MKHLSLITGTKYNTGVEHDSCCWPCLDHQKIAQYWAWPTARDRASTENTIKLAGYHQQQRSLRQERLTDQTCVASLNFADLRSLPEILMTGSEGEYTTAFSFGPGVIILMGPGHRCLLHKTVPVAQTMGQHSFISAPLFAS